MKHSFWETQDYPIYINPLFDELVELGFTKWDTVRICVDREDIGLASGHGNTYNCARRNGNQTRPPSFARVLYLIPGWR